MPCRRSLLPARPAAVVACLVPARHIAADRGMPAIDPKLSCHALESASSCRYLHAWRTHQRCKRLVLPVDPRQRSFPQVCRNYPLPALPFTCALELSPSHICTSPIYLLISSSPQLACISCRIPVCSAYIPNYPRTEQPKPREHPHSWTTRSLRHCSVTPG